MKPKAKSKKEGARSLVDYERDRRVAARRANCPVCHLPKEVRDQLHKARMKKIPRPVQLEWLKKEMGYSITSEALDVHHQGRHDYR